MPDRLLTSLAALGIAFAPAFLRFAGASDDEALEEDVTAEVQCVRNPNAPVHERHKGSNDIEARLVEGAMVQVLSSRQNWHHVAYVFNGQAETGWMTETHLHDCVSEPGLVVTPSGNDGPVVGSTAGGQSFRIATFNIQNLGKTKMGKPTVVDQLVGIMRRYPLVAVQEISDASNQTPPAFLQAINENGRNYEMLISDRSGLQDDDRSSQEQYGFYFDGDAIEARSQGFLFDDSAHDFFVREPFAARFKVRSGNFEFVLITIHTKPDVIDEIGRLHDVVEWARGRFTGEDDFIVVGDYNAGCDYASPEDLDELTLRDTNLYAWFVPDDADTNLASKACAYDRIVATVGTSAGFVQWGVDQAFTDKTVSDHWPVWAEFRVNE